MQIRRTAISAGSGPRTSHSTIAIDGDSAEVAKLTEPQLTNAQMLRIIADWTAKHAR